MNPRAVHLLAISKNLRMIDTAAMAYVTDIAVQAAHPKDRIGFLIPAQSDGV